MSNAGNNASALETSLIKGDIIENTVKKISEERKYKSYQLKIKNTLPKGENYTGEIKKASLVGWKENNEKEELNIIIKTSSQDAKKSFPVNVYYVRELFTYTSFFPVLLKMQEDINIEENQMIKFAELYGGYVDESSEILMFKDLSYDGFKMYDRLTSLDYEHLMLITKTIANFHAHSFAAKHTYPDIYKQGIERAFSRTDFGENFDKVLDQYKEKFINIIQNNDYKDRVSEFLKGSIFDRLLDLLDTGIEGEFPYNIICHGDCWINNFLFKYDQDGKPVQMVLIDWQMNNYSSPLTDIAYFLYSSTDEDMRSEYWDEIFQTYYDTLSARLNLLGIDVDTCYPEQAFKKHIEDKLVSGLLWSPLLVPIVLNSKDAALDCNCFTNEESETPQYSEQCIERLNGIVRDFVKLGYI